MKRHSRKSGRKVRWVPSADEVFTTIELSHSAIKKLFLDEDLSDAEWTALFTSDYLKPSESEEVNAGKKILYDASPFSKINSIPLVFQDIELEAIAYFSKHPELLFSLHPRRFEELVASIFRTNGFDVELTPESRDGGVDIFAARKDGLSGGILHVIECKRYEPSNKVGIGIVQRLLGVVDHHRASKGLVVTTSSFSSDAVQFAAQSKFRLGLNDYTDLTKWIRCIQGK